jgi:Zn-dependent protease
MRWSWRLGNVAGIPIHVHGTFWILVALVGFSHLAGGGSAASLVGGVAFLFAIFGCVLLHELGHALAARLYGIRTKDIVLLPLGGVARLEKMPEKPGQEIVVALAGPAVNVALAAVLAAGLWIGRAFVPVSELGIAAGPFVERLLAVNVLLAVFNLLPAFPMDGGRVLRALLATRLPYPRATRIAAGVGRGMAVLFGLLGLFVNPFLILIAAFVWMGAGQEARHVSLRSSLRGAVAGQAMLRDFRVLDREDKLEKALALVMSGVQREVPVTDGGRLLGFAEEEDLLRETEQSGPHAPVGGAVRETGPAVEAGELLTGVLDRMIRDEVRVVPVTEHGRLVGLLSIGRIYDYGRWREAVGNFADVPPPLRSGAAEDRVRGSVRIG